MRVPLSWLREHVELPAGADARAVGAALVRAGLEVETVEPASQITGPLVIGRVVAFTPEPQKNGKTIRWCDVDVGQTGDPRGIVCGAANFAEGDLVVVALPGAVLPGGFAIAARKTYGHSSDGMICSTRELALGDEHDGILVLDASYSTSAGTPQPGDDAYEVLHLRDDVLDIAVTPDRGYALSIRGIAREVATAYGVPFDDPARAGFHAGEGYPVQVEDPDACPQFTALGVEGLDPSAPSPRWLARRLQLCGMRSISLAVDVTNYVMLELGQPIHAYDRARLSGPIVVRRAVAGEKLETLDGTTRVLDPEDLLITDDSGPIGLAAVMGGASTEISAATTAVVIEAAHFDAVLVSRMSRRHKLSSEASRRFERGVDPRLPAVAGLRVARLLSELAGGTVAATGTIVGDPRPAAPLSVRPDIAARLLGVEVPAHEVVRSLRAVGAEVLEGDELSVTPPSWRPDLTDPADLVEEVARLRGYDTIPAVLPRAAVGRGLTPRQRTLRLVGRALAGAGYVETLAYPFVGLAELDALGLPADDPRRQLVRLANPISDEQPYLRTTLLPGLLGTARRNLGRGQGDLALFETGLVFRPGSAPLPDAPRLSVLHAPEPEQLAALDAALPAQPRRVAVVLTGSRVPAGWWGPTRPVSWADAVEAAHGVARAAGVRLEVTADEHLPWHPGRCAALSIDGTVVGHAGELHPGVVQTLGLPARSAAMELDLDLLGSRVEPLRAPRFSTYPVATQDVALVLDASVPAAAVQAALREGAGELLESIRLFDVYAGDQVGAGQRSLAYALRFRAPDRTLTVQETTAARDAAVALAAERTGAVLRGA